MRPDEFMKKYGFDKAGDEEREHSLRENAWDHATHLKRPHAATPHDWEDWERFKREHPEMVDDDEEEADASTESHSSADGLFRRLLKKLFGGSH